MQTRSVALIALAGFGLGVFAGKGLAALGTDGTIEAPEPPAKMASVPAGHPHVAERSLVDVVMTSLQKRDAPAADASAMMHGASSRGASTELIAAEISGSICSPNGVGDTPWVERGKRLPPRATSS